MDKIEAALDAIKAGEMVIVVDDEDRENEGDLLMAAEKVDQESINFMIKEARGLVCTPIEEELSQKLDLEMMVENNTESHGTAFTISIDHQTVTTGISAQERALTIQKLVDPAVKAEEFMRPGHIFPLVAKKGGVLRRAGHTEAAVDLARLAGLKPAGVICEIIKKDGEMARLVHLKEFAKKHDLKLISIEDLINYRKQKDKLIKFEAEAKLPTAYGEFKIKVFTTKVDN
ncbi:MAG: 3,4-dihydroxy-2-butanone-4-phosphate synthase, partial [Bacillota bacterium]